MIATIREMADGTFHYDLSREVVDGTEGFSDLTAREQTRTSALEGALAELNLDFAEPSGKAPSGWGEVEAEPEITDADLAAISDDLTGYLRRIGLTDRIPLKAMRNLINAATGAGQQGRYRRWRDGRHEIHIAARSGPGRSGRCGMS